MSPRRAEFVVLMLLCLLGPGPALAAAFHVDPNADPGGDGSVAAPYQLLADAVAAAAAGDSLLLAAGHFVESNPLTIGPDQRRAVLALKPGLVVLGAGSDRTFLSAPAASPATFGIALQGGGEETLLRDLAVVGPCVIGVYLWGSAARLENIDVRNDVVGGSSTAFDARENSAPIVSDCRFDGGHNGLFVEFESGGIFTRCTVTRRSREGAVFIDSSPQLIDCVIEGSGRDTVAMSQGSAPRLSNCEIGRGDRWTVRVVGYASGSTVDLSGNRWWTQDVLALAESIMDALDDPSLGASVVFLPFADPLPLGVEGMTRFKLRYGSKDGN